MGKTKLKQPQTDIPSGTLYYGIYTSMQNWDLGNEILPLGQDEARTLFGIRNTSTGIVYIDVDIIADDIKYGFLFFNDSTGSATPSIRFVYEGVTKSTSSTAVAAGRSSFFEVAKSGNVLMMFRPTGLLNM